MINEALKTKNYSWIDTIILTPEFLDYITTDIVKNPSFDFFGTIFETVQFIRQKDCYNMHEYILILKEFLGNIKEKERISELLMHSFKPSFHFLSSILLYTF